MAHNVATLRATLLSALARVNDKTLAHEAREEAAFACEGPYDMLCELAAGGDVDAEAALAEYESLPFDFEF